MEHLKRLNVQKLTLGRTPRRVLYHSVSKTLIVMRTDPGPEGNQVSDICCVDPLSGASHSCYTLETGEVARSIQLWKYRQELLLLVGTSITKAGVLSSGEAERYHTSPNFACLCGTPFSGSECTHFMLFFVVQRVGCWYFS